MNLAALSQRGVLLDRKEIKMNKNTLLDALYMQISEEAKELFDPPELSRKMDAFEEGTLQTVCTPEMYDKATEQFTDVVFDYVTNAFKVGFNTALELMR